MKRYFPKIIFENFWPNFSKIRYLHKSAYASFIVNSRITIHMSYERAWLLYKKIKWYFQKFLKNVKVKFLNITFLLTTYVLLVVEGYFTYWVKVIDVLYKKIKYNFWKYNNIIDSRIIIYISDKINWRSLQISVTVFAIICLYIIQTKFSKR